MMNLVGLGSIDSYLAVTRGEHVPGLEAWARRPWLHERPSTWFGYGGRVLLEHLSTGVVSQATWAALERAARLAWSVDLHLGVSGLASCLAVIGPSNPHRAKPIANVLRRRTGAAIEQWFARYRTGASVYLGMAHGLAGLLLSYEQSCALLAEDAGPLRSQALEIFSAERLEHQGYGYWPVFAGGTTPSVIHSLCHGGPGIAFALLLGHQYSGDGDSSELINDIMSTVAVTGTGDTFCCGTLGRVEVLIEAYRVLEHPALLQSARELFEAVRVEGFGGELNWRAGLGGYRLTQRRLESPMTTDLPGFPRSIAALET